VGAIVKLPPGHYRKIAQEHWGLTNEQMKGKHVHHRIPRSKGGTNDPSNLYVCSPWFHSYVWHSEDSFHPMIEWCERNGRKGGLKKTNPIWNGEYSSMARRDPSTCPVCGRTFVNKGSMVSHQKRVH